MSSVKEEGSYIQSPESRIEKLGLTFSLKNITSKGAIMVFDLTGKEASGGLQFGEDYSLQVEKNGQWENLPTILKDFGVKSIAYVITSNEKAERGIQWHWLYGSLAPGIYRISKRITDIRLNSGPVNYTVYAKFQIN
ncbi:hypothetical protein M9Y10_004132 [Tritrichomonas musculus]|uniref:Bacterial Ig-like domain-containing protein n=1 Tax=Tritrichomonas musculus TaxID=1915356 RepID=A0ABR2JR79_9EUKA